MTCIEFQHSQGSVHRFCGTETFPVPEFYSHDRTAIVTFKSDEYMVNNGVRFTYQATGKTEEMSKKSTYHSLCWFHTVKSNTEIWNAYTFLVFCLKVAAESITSHLVTWRALAGLAISPIIRTVLSFYELPWITQSLSFSTLSVWRTASSVHMIS